VKKLLETQKAACIREGIPPAETRIKRLDKSIELLCDHGDALCEAMSADFGHRSIDQSRFSDISGSIDTLKYAKKNLRSWMRPDKRARHSFRWACLAQGRLCITSPKVWLASSAHGIFR
jgi:coniferyl-aldehyde dehydrogenase